MESVGPPLPGHENCAGFYYVGPKIRVTREGLTNWVRDGPFGTYYCKDCSMVYTGSWSHNKRHGEGFGKSSFGGRLYKGLWHDDKSEGRGRLLLNHRGDEYREGTFVNGYLEGEGSEYGPSDVVYHGNFERGIKCGQGTMETPFYHFRGVFSGDVPHGEGVLTIRGKGIVFTGRVNTIVASLQFGESGLYGEGKLEFIASGSWRKGRIEGGALIGPGETFWEGNLRVGTFGEGGMRGEGKLVYRNGPVYTGSFERDRPHGRGRLDLKNGGVLVGHWVDGSCTGTVTYTHDGDKYEGEWSRGRARGRGKYTFSHGDVWTGLFSDEPYDFTTNGPDCTIERVDGSSYRGRIVDDRCEGRGIARGPFDFQWRYEGDFLKDNFHGRGTWTMPVNGALRKGTWDEGRLHGYGVMVLGDDRGVFKGNFRHDVRHGAFIASILGRSFSMQFQEGKLAGVTEIDYVPVVQLLDLGWADEVKVALPPPPSPPPPSVGLPQCSCCMEAEAAFAMVPCGHMCVCATCAPNFGPEGLRECPICRARIERVMRLFRV